MSKVVSNLSDLIGNLSDLIGNLENLSTQLVNKSDLVGNLLNLVTTLSTFLLVKCDYKSVNLVVNLSHLVWDVSSIQLQNLSISSNNSFLVNVSKCYWIYVWIPFVHRKISNFLIVFFLFTYYYSITSLFCIYNINKIGKFCFLNKINVFIWIIHIFKSFCILDFSSIQDLYV